MIAGMRKQDFCVTMLYFLGYTKIRNWILHMARKPLTRFITFHDIPGFVAENFRDLAKYLKEHTNVISFEEYLAGRVSVSEVNVVITFDDGYKNWATIAAPILKELQLPATFFISSGFIGLDKSQQDRFAHVNLQATQGSSGSLTREEVISISNLGFTIGGHTYNHVDLGGIEDPAKALQEIATDKLFLEELIGRKIHYFAYPFGTSFNPKTDLIAHLKQAGYCAAVTTRAGFNGADSNPFLLARELTGVPMPLCVFKARVTGGYDGVRFLREKLGRPQPCNH